MDKREQLRDVREAIDITKKDLALSRRTLADLECTERDLLQVIRNEKEVMDHEAPNNGMKWSPFEHEQLQDALTDFVYERAKRQGRSTSAIRYRIAEMVAPTIEPRKWLFMKRQL